MRINKLLSNYGICSRKEANKIIEDERVEVNGKIAFKGQWVEESDCIILDGRFLEKKESVYIALNKPTGITCTAAEDVEHNIIKYINYPEYIFPVGRLDKQSQGLIILTNDGELANKILESENIHEKEYIVTLNKSYDEEFIDGMSKGVLLFGEMTRACKVSKVNEITFKITLTQGLNKQIRRMSKSFGYEVVKLERIRIVNIEIQGIEYGKWRYLTEDEVNYLKKI